VSFEETRAKIRERVQKDVRRMLFVLAAEHMHASDDDMEGADIGVSEALSWSLGYSLIGSLNNTSPKETEASLLRSLLVGVEEALDKHNQECSEGSRCGLAKTAREVQKRLRGGHDQPSVEH
jgi:hypothetical protein